MLNLLTFLVAGGLVCMRKKSFCNDVMFASLATKVIYTYSYNEVVQFCVLLNNKYIILLEYYYFFYKYFSLIILLCVNRLLKLIIFFSLNYSFDLQLFSSVK